MRIILFSIWLLYGLNKPLFGQNHAQYDSLFERINQFPSSYLEKTKKQVDLLNKRINGRTEKSLRKLIKWELKIQAIVHKVNPDLESKYFNSNSLSFKNILSQYQKLNNSYQNKYLTTSEFLRSKLQYNIRVNSELIIDSQLVKRSFEFINQIDSIKKTEAVSERIETLINGRRRQLKTLLVKELSKSKYFKKISKESFYYSEYITNYKNLFKDSEHAKSLLYKIAKNIPYLKDILKEVPPNSFDIEDIGNNLEEETNNATSSIDELGFQTNDSIINVINHSSNNFSVRDFLDQSNNQDLLNKFEEYKTRYSKKEMADDLPDFKPNEYKTKLFKQRLDYRITMQFGQWAKSAPQSTVIGLLLGYKLNIKSLVGIGSSYSIGWGDISKGLKIRLTGIELRGFCDWKLKKGLYIGGALTHWILKKESQDNLPVFNATMTKHVPSVELGLRKNFSMSKGKSIIMLIYQVPLETTINNKPHFLFRYGYNLK